ncbi:hypothetical protein [Geodermatophilus sp. SYSU D00815]
MDIRTDHLSPRSRRETGRLPAVRRRALRSLLACTLALAFTMAGQSVAQADRHRGDRGGDGQWGGRSGGWSQEATPAPAPAPAPPPAAAPAAVAATGLSGAPTASSTAYSAWAPHVRPVVAEVAQQHGVTTVLTRPGHSPTQQLAADFMVYGDRAKGDAVAAYVIANAARMKVEYVIWQQRIHVVGGSGWRAMADRGSPTANHMDHVHVAFRR